MTLILMAGWMLKMMNTAFNTYSNLKYKHNTTLDYSRALIDAIRSELLFDVELQDEVSNEELILALNDLEKVRIRLDRIRRREFANNSDTIPER